MRERIGILGGSFDPIHVGHLALGRSAATALALDRLLVIPTGSSWQKADGQTPAVHRLAMTRLAIDDLATGTDPGARCQWVVDDLEVRREGLTYTVDTLAELRRREGPDPALILILGSDQVRNLASWHRWQDLLTHAHVAITRREQVSLADLPPPVEAWLAEHGVDALPDTPAGAVVLFRMPPVAVSATGLRRSLAADLPVDGLLPAAVADYARRHALYTRAADDGRTTDRPPDHSHDGSGNGSPHRSPSVR